MTRHDDTVSLRHMLDHAREAVKLLHGRSRETLSRDRMLELASTRLVEVIGEAAGRVSPERRALHPQIPWSEIVGMRNRLSHGYDVINLDILWRVLNDDLPGLVAKLEDIVPGVDPE